MPTDLGLESGVRARLTELGDDPDRDGLKDTPRRVIKAMREMTVGYKADPVKILSTVFDQEYDEMVTLGPIPFASLCEHHMLPFTGDAWVGYVPFHGKVVGLSKLARLVDCFARRLQIQERLTTQIADAIQEVLKPVGVGVVIDASHSCMTIRGVNKPGSVMRTTKLIGAIRDKPAARAEFFTMIRKR